MDTNMKFYLYGINRIQRDFEYIFKNISIEGYLSNNEAIKEYNGRKVITLKEYSSQPNDSMVLICDFDYNNVAETLEALGMRYESNYIYAHDLFGVLDEPLKEYLETKNIVLFGKGRRASELCIDGFIDRTNILYIDNDEKKRELSETAHVVSPSEYFDRIRREEDLVIIATDAYLEIKIQLQKYGLEEKKDFIWYKEILNRPSKLLTQTIYDRSYYTLDCNTMLNTYEIESTGEVACCCTTFVNERIGNLIWQEFGEIWNSIIHRILCLSTRNHTYTFCKKDMCPVLISKKRNEYNDECKIAEYRDIEQKPKVMLISVDSTCNLYCESCREEICTLKGREFEKADLMADKLLSNDNFDNAEFIVMAGNGEVFLSKIYEKIWKNEKTKHSKRFRLLSNGTLFTPKRWSDFSEGREGEIVVTFSIDAATEDTYSKLRRGGNFNQLIKNLEFASELRQQGCLKYFQISFVVQRANYEEMPKFVELGKYLCVDKVFFTRILNWGTYSPEEFAKISMTDDKGIAIPELQAILDMPIMKDRIVDLGTINSTQNRTEQNYIDNYYMWEIDQFMKNSGRYPK